MLIRHIFLKNRKYYLRGVFGYLSQAMALANKYRLNGYRYTIRKGKSAYFVYAEGGL